jgi:hypothetical protein
LIHEIEKQAEAQNKLEDKEIDIPENGTDL